MLTTRAAGVRRDEHDGSTGDGHIKIDGVQIVWLQGRNGEGDGIEVVEVLD